MNKQMDKPVMNRTTCLVTLSIIFVFWSCVAIVLWSIL